MTTHLVIPDTHAHPDHHNQRFDWLAKLIIDTKPDVVIHLGDSADLPSLSSYDRGRKSFQGRSYAKDINAHLDSQERIWEPVLRRKKRLPRRVILHGNHEDRITRAVDLQPELEGTIGLSDLQLDQWYDDVVPYEGRTPGQIVIDGVVYAHYLVSGVKGTPVGGEHPATSLITKTLTSATVGHLHLADWSRRTASDGRVINGLFAGVYQDYSPDFAGAGAHKWWRGVCLKTNVENGNYDLQMISLDALRREYSNG